MKDYLGTTGTSPVTALDNDDTLDCAVSQQARAIEPNAERLLGSNVTGQSRGTGLGLSGKKKVVITAATMVLLAAAGAGVYFGFFNKSQAAKVTEPPAVVTVSTVCAKVADVDDLLVVTGSVSAWDPLSVGAEVSGLRITSVNVEEGDRVSKGQVLAALNSNLVKAHLDQMKARLRAMEASVKKSIQPNRPEEIHALRAALAHAKANIAQEEAHLKQAKVNLANAELNHNRYAQLARMGAASTQEAEQKQVACETNREEVRSAEEKLNASKFTADQARERLLVAERGGRAEDVEISKATLAETQAQIQELTEQLAQTIIRAPDDGVIAKREAHIGDITSAGKSLFQMIRLNRLELRAQVNDIDLHKFKTSQTVNISTSETDNGKIVGTVKLVSPQVDPVSRLGTVRINIPADAGLKPGMFVRGEVKLGRRQAVTIPASTLVSSHGESWVFLLDEKRAVKRVVHTGVQSDKDVEVLTGLQAGDVVINQGARFLNDRDVVRVSQ